MRIGRLTITWDDLPCDPAARLDALRAEQEQYFAEMTALSQQQFKLLANALCGELGGRVGLGFQKPDDGAGSMVRY